MQLGQNSPIKRTVARMRPALVGIGIFSAVINLLGLTGSIYMLQIYDRVLASRSVETLVAISLLALGLFALQGFIEIMRAQVLSRLGAWLERALLEPVHALLLRLPLIGRSPVEVMQPLRDMEALRSFMGSQAPVALLDLPWMPLYLLLIFALHPWLGGLVLAGMVVLTGLAILSEFRLKEPIRLANMANARRQQVAESTRMNVEVLRAMGFQNRAAARFFEVSRQAQEAGQHAADASATIGGISRMIRVMLQSATLGLGAFLVLRNEMSAGAIIACSILSGRALAPVEQVVAHWKLLVAARQAKRRLDELVRLLGDAPARIDLPEATQSFSVEGVAVAAPGGRIPLMRNATFRLKAGDGLAVIGPSGSGKSVLVRAIAGAWPPLAGHVRIDGASLDQWPIERVGALIGYLPQDVELFEGTIAENIARLDPKADDIAIVAAARAANVHDMILRMPDGYATMLGEGGHNLSVGQRQRIGLARALYGDPFIVILDEPNAHLDQDGDRALLAAVGSIRGRGGIVIIVSHRRDILEGINYAAFVKDGELKAFGPRDEVFKALLAAQQGSVPSQPHKTGSVAPFPGPLSSGGVVSAMMPQRRGAPHARTKPAESEGGGA